MFSLPRRDDECGRRWRKEEWLRHNILLDIFICLFTAIIDMTFLLDRQLGAIISDVSFYLN